MEFKASGMSNVDAEYVFESGFGKMGIGNEETYYDPLREVNKFTEMGKSYEEAVTKAPTMDTTSGGTFTGYGLMPPFLDPSIVDRTVRLTPLVKLLPRKAVKGRSYVYDLISAKGGATFLPDDSPLSEQVDTRSTATVNMKYLYAVGRVTGPAMASARLDLMAEDIRVKTASMNEALENTIINGNATTNPLEFTGLIQSITTNASDNAGVAIDLATIRADINTSFEANGLIDLAVTDGYTFNYIKGLLTDFQRINSEAKIGMKFGILDAFEIDGVLFIKDRYMPTTATQREILYLDTRYVFMAVLQDYTFEELAKTNDSKKYMIKWYGSLVVNFESAMVRRYNLA